MSPIPAEFKELETFEDWKEKLSALLDEAAKIAELDTGDDAVLDRLLKLNDRLTAFQNWSDPEVDGTDELDRIAKQARQDLLESSINRRIQAIAARSADLEVAGKVLERRSIRDAAEAAAIRAEAVSEALHAVNTAVSSAISLKQSLDPVEDADFARKLEKALDSLQSIRDEIGTLARDG